MKISELKSPYKEMALANQVLQGNVEDESKDLMDDANMGNFLHDETKEGDVWWDAVNDGRVPEITDNIKLSYPQIFGKQESTPVAMYEHLYGKRVSMNDRFETEHIWSEELAIKNNGKWLPRLIEQSTPVEDKGQEETIPESKFVQFLKWFTENNCAYNAETKKYLHNGKDDLSEQDILNEFYNSISIKK